MKTTRRTFIGGAVAFAPIAGLWAEEAPLLKIGVMTDTHVGKTKAVALALGLRMNSSAISALT